MGLGVLGFGVSEFSVFFFLGGGWLGFRGFGFRSFGFWVLGMSAQRTQGSLKCILVVGRGGGEYIPGLLWLVRIYAGVQHRNLHLELQLYEFMGGGVSLIVVAPASHIRRRPRASREKFHGISRSPELSSSYASGDTSIRSMDWEKGIVNFVN